MYRCLYIHTCIHNNYTQTFQALSGLYPPHPPPNFMISSLFFDAPNPGNVAHMHLSEGQPCGE